MDAARVLVTATVVGILALSAASAARLVLDTPPSLGAGGEEIVAPPVAVTNVEWITDLEDGKGFVVDEVRVTLTFTDDFDGRLGFYIALTGQSPLPLEHNEDKNLDKSLGSTTTIEASFESHDIPAEAVEDIHVLVCDDVDAKPPGVCAVVP